jgi:hypothetical protein
MKVARKNAYGKSKPRVVRTTPPILASKGWSATAAARRFGVSTGHLIRVINGERPQGRLMPKVAELPDLKEVAP